ncbi:MAG: glutamate-cysteine ligase family protein [Candidatus Deferrimicrobiaceae bacterium]
MSPAKKPRPLFEGLGVELEYMIVDRDTLSVLPVTDELLRSVAGEYRDEVEQGPLCWSNEMALHVVELKTNGPVSALTGLAAAFSGHVGRINALLLPLGGKLMPSGMHPLMDPARETRFWPHRNRAIYESYHRIFDCRRHGWANLQSIHLNLSFHGDEEFARLHAAARFLIPILPAIAASSPVVEGKVTGLLDNRLEAYRGNQQKIPSITGRVIPEAVYSRRRYQDKILRRMYRDIAPYDPKKILRHEWLNSRGAIPRFDRDTIELRILDVQECPQADIAIISAVVETLKGLVRERFTSVEELMAWEIDPLEEIFLAVLREGESAGIRDRRYLSVFGLSRESMTAGELWAHLVGVLMKEATEDDRAVLRALNVILARGTLARRIVHRLGKTPSRGRIRTVYRELCDCLSEGRMFLS